MKLLTILEKSKQFWFLLIIFIVFFLLRLPSLFEPNWYGDEGIYQVLGDGINNGRLLYKDIWDNKPPLLYVTYAIFSSDQFWIRLISLIFGLLSVVVFFFFSKELFREKKTVFITTSFYAILFGLPFLEGNIANSENFMLFPILLSGFLVFKSVDTRHSGKSRLNRDDSRIPSIFRFWTSQNDQFKFFIAGLLLSFAFLFKTVTIFDFAAFFLFLFFIESLKSPKLPIDTFPFFAGFILPIFATSLFFILRGAFPDFLKAAIFQNVGYVGYGNKFLIPQGLLFIKLFILFLFSLIIFIKRKSINTTTIFVLLWFSFSIFNALFSQRPYTHYLLVLLPSFSLFLGLLFLDKKFQKIYFIFLVFLLILLSKSFTVYGKTNRYYQNFISFITGSKSVYEYRSFFDRNTPKDYDLAQFIKTNTNNNDNIFIWGNNAQVYKLSNKLPPGRFTVLYHITASNEYLNETLYAIKRIKPKYIIVTSLKNPSPFDLNDYTYKLNINNSLIYEYNL